MPEIDIIKALRSGNASSFLSSDPAQIGTPIGALPHICAGAERMMREGWIRPREGFDTVKSGVWRNEGIVERLLRDL